MELVRAEQITSSYCYLAVCFGKQRKDSWLQNKIKMGCLSTKKEKERLAKFFED